MTYDDASAEPILTVFRTFIRPAAAKRAARIVPIEDAKSSKTQGLNVHCSARVVG